MGRMRPRRRCSALLMRAATCRAVSESDATMSSRVVGWRRDALRYLGIPGVILGIVPAGGMGFKDCLLHSNDAQIASPSTSRYWH